MSTVSTVNGPSGYRGNLDFSYPPKVQKPSPVRKIQSPTYKFVPHLAFRRFVMIFCVKLLYLFELPKSSRIYFYKLNNLSTMTRVCCVKSVLSIIMRRLLGLD